MRKPTFWFPTWSDTNKAVHKQKMTRGFKCRILKVEGLNYLCSETKGADQLCGYREADLCRCLRISKTLVFSRRGSFSFEPNLSLFEVKTEEHHSSFREQNFACLTCDPSQARTLNLVMIKRILEIYQQGRGTSSFFTVLATYPNITTN